LSDIHVFNWLEQASSKLLAEGVNPMAMSETERMELAAEHEAGIFSATMPAALALVVLGILALAKIDPLLLVCIAVLVAGVLLASDSAALTRQIATALESKPNYHINGSQLPVGLNAGVFGGISGVVLGILAILNVAPHTLIAIAAIVFGAAVLFDFRARSQLRALRMTASDPSEYSARLAVAAASSSSTASIFTGVALVTLGILALTGLDVVVLIAVGLLGLGAYLLMEDSVMTGHVMSLFES
jgi:hypothetical protein